MKLRYAVIFVLSLFVVSSSLMFAQAAGDYRSNAPLPTGGNWSVAGNWQKYSGTVWQLATSAPTGSEVITILATDSIRVDQAVTITDTLINQGKLVDLGNLTIGDGGIYKHDQNGGRIPTAVWNSGATLMVSGVGTGGSSQAPSNGKQTFHHIVWNCPNQASNVNLGWNPSAAGGDTTVDVGGTITVMNTGVSRWQLSAPQSGADADHYTTARVVIHGGINVSGGAFSSNGTSNAYVNVIVTTLGNVNVTGGNFSVSRGSMSGMGTVTWYLEGDSIAMSNATTQNSNSVPGAAKFVFSKAGTQFLRIGSGNTMTSFPMEVASGTLLDAGGSAIYGNGIVIVDSGATIATAHAGGLDSLFAGTGTKTLSPRASYTFNGSAAQVTGTLLPAEVENLTIDNAAGVTLTRTTTINGTLHLKAGEFDNTIPFTLGPSGVISYEGGSLRISSSVEDPGDGIPRAFFVDQNYPNPFNPTTTIRFGLPAKSEVTVSVRTLLGQEIATMYNGPMNAGVHRLTFNAGGLSSGVYFYWIRTDAHLQVKPMVLVK